MHTSTRGRAMIVDFEGFEARPYNDSNRFATVGVGHLLHRSPVSDADRRAVWVRGQQQPGVLNRTEAIELMATDLPRYEEPVNELHLKLTQNQFDAVVSAVFNLGPGVLQPDRSLGGALRAGNWRAAADALLLYDRDANGRRLEGLTRRRTQERALFLKRETRLDRWRAELDKRRAQLQDATDPERRKKLIARINSLKTAIHRERSA